MTVLQILLTQLCDDDDDQAESAVHKIAELGQEALPDLSALAVSSDADARWWSLRTLALISAPGAQTMLQAGLHDVDLAVRQCAALGLKHQPTQAAIPDLITTLHEDDQLLTRLAADALIAIGPDAVPALIKVLQREHASGRTEAARALALLEDESAIPTLFAVLDDELMLVQYWAEDGLSRLGVGMTFFSPQ